MKVEIKVFNKRKDGTYDIDTIVKYDGFISPEVIEMGIPIERCNLEFDRLKIFVDEYPSRIDIDTRFGAIFLMDKSRAQAYPYGYTFLEKDRNQAQILWSKKGNK